MVSPGKLIHFRSLCYNRVMEADPREKETAESRLSAIQINGHWWAAMIVLILSLLSGCLSQAPEKPDEPLDEFTLCEISLRDFFDTLHAGEYETAAELYGGTYDTLTDMNPDLAPIDFPALWERACTVNGFQCLRVGEILGVVRTREGECILTVQFLQENGEIFFRGPCCGADETSIPPISEFEFRVSRDDSGQYWVLDLPVYVP